MTATHKNLLSLLTLFMSTGLFAQISLEHTYSHTGSVSSAIFQKFTSLGTKLIIQKNTPDKSVISIYNSDHSLYKSFTLFPDTPNYAMTNFAFSDQLFNNDNKIEVFYHMYDNGGGGSGGLLRAKVRVVNEDGVVVFNVDSAQPAGNGGLNNSILKDSSGVKLLIYKYRPGSPYNQDVQLYSLPGIIPASGMVSQPLKQVNIAEAFPNPATVKTIIPYSLPEGADWGQVFIYNLKGEEVRRYTVTKDFNTLEVQNQFPEGVYLYQLVANGISSESKKLLFIK